MLWKAAAGAAVALALAGCAGTRPEEKLPVQPQAPGVALTRQQDGRFIAFIGPRQQHTAPFLGVADTNFFALRSWLDNRTGEAAHQLYIEDSYFGAPSKWDGVHDQDNKPLRFVAISRNEITCDQGCSYADEFAAALPEDYMRAHRGGMTITFTSADGRSLPVAVPADLVTAELDAVDAVRAAGGKAAATPPANPAASPAASSSASPAAETTASAAKP